MIEQKFKEGMKRKSVNPPGYAEVERYLDAVESLTDSTVLAEPDTRLSAT